MNQLPAVWSVARTGLRRSAGRRVLMVLILALAIAVYLLYSTYMLGVSGEAQALIGDLELPADLVFIGRRTLSPAEVQDVASRGAVQESETARVIWYKSAAGYVRLVALAPDSRLWSQLLGPSPGSGGLAIPKPTAQEVLIPSGLSARTGLGPGDDLDLVPPQATAGRSALRVAGVHGATDDLLADCAITLMSPTGARPNSMLLWTHSPAGARSLASSFVVEYGGPSRPLLLRMDDPTVLMAGTPLILSSQVLAQTYMPGVSALGLIFVFCGIGLFCVTSLSFMDRRRDLAILKTMGLESQGVLALLLIEQGMIAAAGVALGTMLAAGLLSRLGGMLPGEGVLTTLTVVKGVVVGPLVLFAAVVFPSSLARAATVNQLLFNLPVTLYRQRVSGTTDL